MFIWQLDHSKILFMKKYILTIATIISLASCVPPGKLSEALDANTMLNSKYDSLSSKLTDTIANFSNSISVLNNNVNNLIDSVSYYRALADKPTVITEGEVFLNQMLGLSLLNKSELRNLVEGLQTKGYTCVPLKMYCTNTQLWKIEIALVTGLKKWDKRELIKKKDLDRASRRSDN
jgi:hypothetical protein